MVIVSHATEFHAGNTKGDIKDIGSYLLDKNGNKIYDKRKRTYKCRTVQTTDWNSREKAEEWREAWSEFLNNALEQRITPENSLDNSDIVYPQWDSDKSRCDTDLWIDLSYELVGDHPDWSDEFKLFVFNEWMMSNIRYDWWRHENGQSRAAEYNDWTGTYSMWDLKVGVCCDFSNALIIMLREHGIPATSLETATHMWIAVRLLIEESLDVEAARANQSLIRNYIHEEVNNSLGPYMSQITGILEKRIIPICAKASRTSAISFALIIGMLTENYTDGRTHEQLLSTAMKYAGQYLKEKPHSEEEYLAAAREVLNSAYGFSNTDDGI